MRITVSTDLGDFADVWPDLAAMNQAGAAFAGFPFQARDYLETWAATMGAARKTRAQFVRVDGADGRPFLLLPLGIEEKRGVRTLGFLDGGVVDYAAPVVFAGQAPPASAAELWEAIFAALPPFDVLSLEKMPEQVLTAPNPLYATEGSDGSADGHCVRLEGAWADFAKTRLPRAQTSRRKRRRLAEQGALRFAIAETQTERAEFLAAMVRQKTRRYLETRGVDGFDRPGYRTYFEALTDRFASGGFVQLSALIAGETIVATHWGMVSGGRYYYLMPASEAGEWQKFSPGNLLTEDLIQWCFANGIAAFDLGVGDEAYKHEFAPDTLRLQWIERGHSLLGKAVVPTMRTLRQVKRRLQAPQHAAPAEGA